MNLTHFLFGAIIWLLSMYTVSQLTRYSVAANLNLMTLVFNRSAEKCVVENTVGQIVEISPAQGAFSSDLNTTWLHVHKFVDSSMFAVNFADQSKSYLHHEVFGQMPISYLPVRREHVTEFTGLVIPSRFDCSPNGMGDRMNYLQTVPERWFKCYHLESLIRSGQKIFMPSYPVIDEEYPEAVAVYEAAMSAKGVFSMIEIGARWGTWGYRAAAAIKKFNPSVRVDLLFIEPSTQGCAAIDEIARINNFLPPQFNITKICSFAKKEHIIDWIKHRTMIDLLDSDIQGAEFQLFPSISSIIRSKVKRLIVGVHTGQDIKWKSLLDLFREWKQVSKALGLASLPDNAGWCASRLRSDGNKWDIQSQIQDDVRCKHKLHLLVKAGRFGRILTGDGELILDNPRFTTSLN